MDFRKVWFLTNSSMTLFCSPVNGTVGANGLPWRVIAWQADSDIDADHDMRMGCMAKMKGRLYIAGFNGDDAHYGSVGDKSWEQLWHSWIESQFTSELTYEDMAMGHNVIFYSGLRGGDYWWPFAVEMELFGIHGAQAFLDGVPFCLDSIRKTDIGFVISPLNGEVLRMGQLGDNLILYARDGVAVVNVAAGQEGIVSHYAEKISNVGILSKTAILMTPSMHIFVDSKGHIRRMTSEGIQDLDFSEYFRGEYETIEGKVAVDLTQSAAPVVLSYDDEFGDTYITNGDIGYILTADGALGETTLQPSSLDSSNGVLTGYYNDQTDEYGSVVRVITQVLDFEERMLKSIHDVEVSTYDITNFYTRIQFVVDGSSNWRYSPWLLAVDGGFTVPLVEGHNIRLEFKYTPGDRARFDYAKLNWFRRDARNFRLHHFRR